MLKVLAVSAVFFYFIAALMQILRMRGNQNSALKFSFILGLLGLITHAYLLHQWIDVPGGQNLTFFNALSQVIWIAAVIVWLMSLFRPLVNLGMILYPVAALSIIMVMAFSGTYIINTLAEPKRLFHILLSFLSISILIVAAIQAVLLALLERALRKKHAHPMMEALAPLQKMESLLFQLIALGFIILSSVIYTGFDFYPDIFSHALWHHMVLAIASWLVLGILLLGRWFFGWRGFMAVRISLMGIGLILVAFITGHFWSF